MATGVGGPIAEAYSAQASRLIVMSVVVAAVAWAALILRGLIFGAVGLLALGAVFSLANRAILKGRAIKLGRTPNLLDPSNKGAILILSGFGLAIVAGAGMIASSATHANDALFGSAFVGVLIGLGVLVGGVQIDSAAMPKNDF